MTIQYVMSIVVDVLLYSNPGGEGGNIKGELWLVPEQVTRLPTEYRVSYFLYLISGAAR
jgi:hypothetical protein